MHVSLKTDRKIFNTESGDSKDFFSNIYSTNFKKKGENKVKLLENVLKRTDLMKTGKPWYLFFLC